MAWLRRIEDRAEGAVVGELMLVGIGLVAAVTLMGVYAGKPDAPPPVSAAWTLDGGGGRPYALTLAAALPPIEWASIEVAIEGSPLRYDAALAPGTYCVVTNGSACGGTVEAGARLTAGQQVRFHAASGDELTLRQADANALLYRATLR